MKMSALMKKKAKPLSPEERKQVRAKVRERRRTLQFQMFQRVKVIGQVAPAAEEKIAKMQKDFATQRDMMGTALRKRERSKLSRETKELRQDNRIEPHIEMQPIQHQFANELVEAQAKAAEARRQLDKLMQDYRAQKPLTTPANYEAFRREFSEREAVLRRAFEEANSLISNAPRTKAPTGAAPGAPTLPQSDYNNAVLRPIVPSERGRKTSTLTINKGAAELFGVQITKQDMAKPLSLVVRLRKKYQYVKPKRRLPFHVDEHAAPKQWADRVNPNAPAVPAVSATERPEVENSWRVRGFKVKRSTVSNVFRSMHTGYVSLRLKSGKEYLLPEFALEKLLHKESIDKLLLSPDVVPRRNDAEIANKFIVLDAGKHKDGTPRRYTLGDADAARRKQLAESAAAHAKVNEARRDAEAEVHTESAAEIAKKASMRLVGLDVATLLYNHGKKGWTRTKRGALKHRTDAGKWSYKKQRPKNRK